MAFVLGIDDIRRSRISGELRAGRRAYTDVFTACPVNYHSVQMGLAPAEGGGRLRRRHFLRFSAAFSRPNLLPASGILVRNAGYTEPDCAGNQASDTRTTLVSISPS